MHDQAASLRRLASQPLRAPSFAFIGAAGTGITTLVTELAVALTWQNVPTLVADCQSTQQQARRLGVPDSGSLAGQLISSGGLAAMMTRSRHGVTLLNLNASLEERARLSPQLWLKLGSEFAALERDAAALLIDCPNPAHDPVPACVADNLIVVLGPEEHTLTSAYAAIKRLSSEGGRHIFNVLVNRVGSLAEARERFNRLSAVAADFLNASLRWLGFVPDDPTIRRSQMLRRPLMEAFPDSEAAQAFTQLAAMLPQWHTVETQRPDSGYFDLLISVSRDWHSAARN